MKTGVVGVFAVVLVGAVVVAAPAGAIEGEGALALVEQARGVSADSDAMESALKATKTIVVRCDKRESVQAALDKNPGPVTIEIQGVCRENVTVSRDWVTLRGRDPATDGIESQMADLYSDGLRPAVVAWMASPVVLENLTLRGGLSVIGNLYYAPADLPYAYSYGEFFHVTNCILEGGAVNVSVRDGYLTLRDVTVGASSLYGIYCLRGQVQCWRCHVENGNSGGAAVQLAQFSRGDFTDSTITASGGTPAFQMYVSSRAWLISSQVTAAEGSALEVDINSQLGVNSSEFSGPLRVSRNSVIQLKGSTQVVNPHQNHVRVDSTLFTDGTTDAPNTLVGPLWIYDFGRAVLRGTTVDGDLECFTGGDAVADETGVTVTGSITGCEHTPGP